MKNITKASYAVLAACVLAHFLNHVYTGVLSPFLPIIKEELSLNLTQIGIITSAAIFTMTVTHLAVGFFADRGWRDIFISISVLLSAIVVLLTSFANAFIFLVITQTMLGIGASGYHPSAFPAITEKFPTNARAKAIGVQAMGGLVGMALVPFLGVALLVLLGGWRAALVALGIVGVLVFFITFSLMRYSANVTKIESSSENEAEGEEGWTKEYALSMILTGLRGIPFRCINLLMPVYLVESYGYEPVWAGSLTTIMLSAGLVAELVSGPLSDRIQRRTPFVVLSPLLMTPTLLLLNYSLDPVFLLIVLIGIGFFFFMGAPPFQAYQTEIAPKHARGLAFGLLFSVGAIPGAISPVIFGAIGDAFGLSASILFLATTSFAATFVALLLKEPKNGRQVVTSELL